MPEWVVIWVLFVFACIGAGSIICLLWWLWEKV